MVGFDVSLNQTNFWELVQEYIDVDRLGCAVFWKLTH